MNREIVPKIAPTTSVAAGLIVKVEVVVVGIVCTLVGRPGGTDVG
jgi:hypothetical protein